MPGLHATAQAPTANPLAKKIAVTPIRARMIDGFRDAHRWLAELTSDSRQTIESMAAREGKTVRWIRRTLSLAFLSPALAKAAIACVRTTAGGKNHADDP